MQMRKDFCLAVIFFSIVFGANGFSSLFVGSLLSCFPKSLWGAVTQMSDNLVELTEILRDSVTIVWLVMLRSSSCC